MKSLSFTFLLAITCSVFHVTFSEPLPAQECAPLTFQGISTEAWICIRSKLTEMRFKVSPGNSGEISEVDTAGDFGFDPGQRTLTITIKRHSSACATVIRALTEGIDACRDFEEIRLVQRSAGAETWRIDAPNIKQPETAYRQIRFRHNDNVTVTAGGCVQHGGPGKTWSLYVDPLKQNPTPDYYGRIKLPGMPSFMRIKDLLSSGGDYKVRNDAVGDMFLMLGFSDFRHADNGYWGRKGDDGYNDQCNNIGNAWVEIRIVHATR